MYRNPDRTNVRGMWGLNHRNQNDYAIQNRVNCEDEMDSHRDDIVFRCGADDLDNSHRDELEGYDVYCFTEMHKRGSN